MEGFGPDQACPLLLSADRNRLDNGGGAEQVEYLKDNGIQTETGLFLRANGSQIGTRLITDGSLQEDRNGIGS